MALIACNRDAYASQVAGGPPTDFPTWLDALQVDDTGELVIHDGAGIVLVASKAGSWVQLITAGSIMELYN